MFSETFSAESEKHLYQELKDKPNDPENIKTIAAMHAITEFHGNFAHGYDLRY